MCSSLFLTFLLFSFILPIYPLFVRLFLLYKDVKFCISERFRCVYISYLFLHYGEKMIRNQLNDSSNLTIDKFLYYSVIYGPLAMTPLIHLKILKKFAISMGWGVYCQKYNRKILPSLLNSTVLI